MWCVYVWVCTGMDGIEWRSYSFFCFIWVESWPNFPFLTHQCGMPTAIHFLSFLIWYSPCVLVSFLVFATSIITILLRLLHYYQLLVVPSHLLHWSLRPLWLVSLLLLLLILLQTSITPCRNQLWILRRYTYTHTFTYTISFWSTGLQSTIDLLLIQRC